MSTLSINPTPAPAGCSPGGVAEDRRPPLARLTAVELRKMVNTRSGFWVLITVAVMTMLVALISVTNHGGRGATYTHVFHDASLPSAYLLPIVGILLICAEWTQRTTLTTFTLVPVRRRAIFGEGGRQPARLGGRAHRVTCGLDAAGRCASGMSPAARETFRSR